MAPDASQLLSALRTRATDFDLRALLDLLAHLGFEPDDIELRSHESWSLQPHEVLAIDPVEACPAHPRGRVQVTLSMGLLSARSPLPQYFRGLLRDLDFGPALRDHLRCIDARLLAERARALAGVRDRPVWRRAFADLHQVGGPLAPATLRALFRAVFPDLGIRVRRTRRPANVPAEAARLGTARLGQCALGGAARLDVWGLDVVLHAPEDPDPALSPERVRRRLRDIALPRLAALEMPLRVILSVPRSAGAQPRLGSSSALGGERAVALPHAAPLGESPGHDRLVLVDGAIAPTPGDAPTRGDQKSGHPSPWTGNPKPKPVETAGDARPPGPAPAPPLSIQGPPS